jgi:hypothetical protein
MGFTTGTGASVVTAERVPHKPKEIPMTKAKGPTPAHSNRNKSVRQSKPAPKTVRRATVHKPNAPITAGQHHQPSSRLRGRPQSKRAQVIAMLHTPAGATIDAMMRATGWQQHSVRGFLAGVIRKKLALNLVSEASKNGRLYRIVGQAGSPPIAAVKKSRAA